MAQCFSFYDILRFQEIVTLLIHFLMDIDNISRSLMVVCYYTYFTTNKEKRLFWLINILLNVRCHIFSDRNPLVIAHKLLSEIIAYQLMLACHASPAFIRWHYSICRGNQHLFNKIGTKHNNYIEILSLNSNNMWQYVNDLKHLLELRRNLNEYTMSRYYMQIHS